MHSFLRRVVCLLQTPALAQRRPLCSVMLTTTFHQGPGPGPGQGHHSQGPGQGPGIEYRTTT